MLHLQDMMHITMTGCDGITQYMYHSQKHKSHAFAMLHHTIEQGVLMLSHTFSTTEAQTHDECDQVASQMRSVVFANNPQFCCFQV